MMMMIFIIILVLTCYGIDASHNEWSDDGVQVKSDDGKMNAVVATGISSNLSSVVNFVRKDIPEPSLTEVLIKVRASSVNPVDWKIVEEKGLPLRFPHTLGFDVSGEIVKKGGLTSNRLKVGDEVWADLGKTWLLSGGELGAYAEYAVADESQVGLKPKSMNFTDAASIPLVGLTTLEAYRKIQDVGVSFENATVVVTSGSGGTGLIGIQMAKAYKARKVVTACGPTHQSYCASLGADVVVDYTKGKTALWDALENDSVDIVYDNFGANGTADLAMPKLGSNSAYLFLPGKGGSVSKHPKTGVHQINFGLADSSHYSDLDALAKLVDQGLLHSHVSELFSLNSTLDALETSEAGGVVGKLGIFVQ